MSESVWILEDALLLAGPAIWNAGVGTPGVTSGLQPMPVPNRKAPNTRSKILSATSFVMDANRAQSMSISGRVGNSAFISSYDKLVLKSENQCNL